MNKSEDNDWFKIESNKEGTKFFFIMKTHLIKYFLF